MKQLSKHILMMLGLLLFISSQSIAQSNWAPIMMGDITTFVPYQKNTIPHTPIKTLKDTYNVNETISVTVDKSLLTGKDDRVGVFRKNDKQEWDWDVVRKWQWTPIANIYQLILGDKELPVGEYEIRLYTDFSSHPMPKASYSFSVGGGVKDYGKAGPYIDQIHINDDTGNGKIYYIKDTPNLPTVAFIGGAASTKYDGLRKYVASWGYQVVVLKTSETSKYVVNELKNLLNYVHDNYKADISKLGMMGKSLNGGSTFHNMKELKKDGFAGSQKSACISLDGWFPFSMKQQDMHSFTTPVMFIQYGGADGIDKESGETDGYKFYQDPNINVTNFKELKKVNIYLTFAPK